MESKWKIPSDNVEQIMTKLKNYSDRFDYLMNTIFGQNPKESLIKMTLSRQKSVRWCTSWKRHVLKSKKVWREEDLAHRVCKEEHPQGGEAKVQFLNWHLLGRCDLNDWAATATSWVGRLHLEIFLVGHQVRYFGGNIHGAIFLVKIFLVRYSL